MRKSLRAWIIVAAAAFAALPAAATDDDMPPVDYPAIPERVADRSQFVPPGWKLEAEAKGDLDGDKRADLALVIQSEKPDLSFSGTPLVGPRMLIVAFASGEGYSMALVNHDLIPRSDNSNVEDCFDAESGGLAIGKGKLVVKLGFFATAGGWDMWTKTYAFAWKQGQMRLSRFDYRNTHRGSGKTTLTVADYDAGTLKITRGSIENDRTRTKRTKLSGPRRISLDQVGDGMDFDPSPPESSESDEE
ncbi:hypothetical protein EPK99_20755 [Neorhizobium lilium]|uniref:Uncharacterized protein n=1 Tax=Neorhizobium lilium TaxID=2503024 RepID=A0A444LE27_9HYPH|nr:hypothetical protein [Neorhizobium lilium]RWX76081.1 hypothetical protein EPK99_20755 [Neorhizobium lilium]